MRRGRGREQRSDRDELAELLLRYSLLSLNPASVAGLAEKKQDACQPRKSLILLGTYVRGRLRLSRSSTRKSIALAPESAILSASSHSKFIRHAPQQVRCCRPVGQEQRHTRRRRALVTDAATNKKPVPRGRAPCCVERGAYALRRAAQTETCETEAEQGESVPGSGTRAT